MYADDVKIIAVDFDGVLCENKYPEIGLPNEEIFEYLESEKKRGTKLILWTCRTGGTLNNAIEWCAEHGLTFDAVNENVQEIKDVFGDGRKVFANEYIDDRMNRDFRLPFHPFEGKYSLDAWAENEIQLGCEREKEGEEDDWDYGVLCYKSALKAFYSLLEDGHSGVSIWFTKSILDRLVDGKPLSPIEDDDKYWDDVTEDMGEPIINRYSRVYRCVRYSPLFKYIKKDGGFEYCDCEYSRCIDIYNHHLVYHSGFVSRMIARMLPITFPYFPVKPIDVYCTDFLADKNNSDDDFDTIGIFYAVKPDGTRVDINRYFKQSLETNDFIEISEREYQMREDGSTNA